MDEALAHAVVDLSGRAAANISVYPDEGMVAHAFESLVQTARITLHVTASGENAHHVAEAAFKAVGRAMAQALAKNGRPGAIDQRFSVNSVVVVDYGAGNTRSVRAALTHLGRDSMVSSDPGSIRDAEFVILPGVGSARSAMNHLNDSGAATALSNRFRDGGAILGICLGLQLAMEHSEEDGGVTGLGLFRGTSYAFERAACRASGGRSWNRGARLYYFAHSYAVRSEDAVASVDGVTVAVRRDAFLGVQFHPEKSGTGRS